MRCKSNVISMNRKIYLIYLGIITLLIYFTAQNISLVIFFIETNQKCLQDIYRNYIFTSKLYIEVI